MKRRRSGEEPLDLIIFEPPQMPRNTVARERISAAP